MHIIPSLDILNGQCVQLTQGNFRDVEVYDKDPVTVARDYEQSGARRIHIVDLDAVRGAGQVNQKKIRKIRKAVSCSIEIGGGIRDDNDIERLLDIGIDRLVVGTVFARSPNLVQGWIAHYGRIFLAAIDARDGQVFVDGWEQEIRSKDVELARRVKTAGLKAIIYTNILRDGMLNGPDIDRTNAITQAAVDIPVILSGGISSMDDLQMMKENSHQNVVGVILGKVLFKQDINLADAIKTFGDSEDSIDI